MNSKTWSVLTTLAAVLLCLPFVASCGGDRSDVQPGPSGSGPVSLDAGERLRVVATTNIVGDVVHNIGGDNIELTTLMSVGVDPHSYVPTPSDIGAVHDAHVVFANGAGLESTIEEMLANAGGEAVQVYVSDGLELRPAADSDHGEVDPHVWFDVQNVIHWSDIIASGLSTLDPAHADDYRANADSYTTTLSDLDAWVLEQLSTIPEERRILVTNHPVFGYLADRYGLRQIGAIYPISPSGEPSAQDIAALEDTIRELGVRSVFSESTVSPKLAEQIVADTGIRLVSLYTGSLGAPGSGAETYVQMMRYDIAALVEALR